MANAKVDHNNMVWFYITVSTEFAEGKSLLKMVQTAVVDKPVFAVFLNWLK